MPRTPTPPRLERDRKNKKNGNYYVYWTEAGRSREHSTRTRDREQAEIYFAEWKLRRLRPDRAIEPHEFFVANAVANYLSKRMNHVADPERLANAARPVIEFFDGYTVGDLNEVLILEYCSKRKNTRNGRVVQPGTLRRELSLLSSAIKRAYDDQMITRLVSVPLPSKPEGRIRFLTCDEAIEMIRASRSFDAPTEAGVLVESKTEHLTLFLRIGLLTGQRKEAILSLKWADVDFQSGIIYWNPVGRRRTKKERPTSRIPTRLTKYLRRRKARFPHDDYVITHRGKPVDDVKRSFASAVKAANIESEGNKKVVPHTLRHTCATWLMQKGAPKWDACGFLGMSMETLERNYGHHHPNHQRGASDLI